MRPTDENQHGSTRPNLMSASRPGGGEDNILAMLDRDAGRGRGSQFSSPPRMAWYAGAGALVVAMVGALGWLAWENAHRDPELTVETTLVLPSEGTTVATAPEAQGTPVAQVAASGRPEQPLHAAAGPAASAVHHALPLPAVAAAATVQAAPVVLQTAGAAIIDNPAPASEAPVLLAQASPVATSAPETAQPSRLPPLVLLPPEEAGPKRTPKAAPAQSKAPAGLASQAGHSPDSAPAAKAEVASRPAAKTARAPTSRLASKGDAAPGTRSAAKADTGRATAKAPARRAVKTVAARARKTPAPAAAAASAKPQDSAADGDVALISAIIMHSSRHAAERAKAEAAKGCEGGKCPAK